MHKAATPEHEHGPAHMSTDDEDTRPNPEYAALEEMLTDAEALESDIAGALNDAHNIMDSGRAWIGRTVAQPFLEDLEYRKDDLPTQAQRLVDAIRDALNNTPEEIAVVPGASASGGNDLPI
jgi:hypothetical protein